MMKIELSMQALSLAIQAVLPAASVDKDNLAINGVCLQVVDGELHALATCGTWLARVRQELEYGDEGFRILVPMKHVKKLVALIGDSEGHAIVARDKGLARFTLHDVGSLDLRFGLAEVPFPNTEKMWPTGPAEALTRIGLNPTLMAALAKTFKTACGTQPMLAFAFRGEKMPIVVSCDLAPHCTALLMPCALNDEEEPDPQGRLFGRNDPGQAEQ